MRYTMRIGNDKLKRDYRSEIFRKIEMKNPIQDIQFNGRLSKGDTYLIGEGVREKFYITQFHDGSVELWKRRFQRSAYIEETIVCLTDYEVDCIYKMIDVFYEMIMNDYEPTEEMEKSIEEAADTVERAAEKTGTVIWTDDLKNEFLHLRIIKQMKLSEIAKDMGMRKGQIKGIQKYYKSGRMDHLVKDMLQRCS
jgi:hypothetical protein